MSLLHQLVPHGKPASRPKKSVNTKKATPRNQATVDGRKQVAVDVCPTCGMRIRPKTDRKTYQREYQRIRRAKKREERDK